MKVASYCFVVLAISDALNGAEILPQNDALFAEIASLFRSDASAEYSTEEDLIRFHSRFNTKTKENAYTQFGKPHPYVIKLNDNCGPKCQIKLAKKFTKDRYTTIDKTHAMVFSSLDDIEQYQRNHPDSIVFQTVLHPDLKIAPEIKLIQPDGEGCVSRYTELKHADGEVKNTVKKAEIKILIDIIPLDAEEMYEFLEFVKDLSSEYDDAFQFEFDEVANLSQSGPMRGFIVTQHCDMVLEVVKRFSQRREVSWMERYSTVVAHNRWSRGVCDTNDISYFPLEQIHLNGTGEIVGVSDTGLDLTNCYFHHNITFHYELSTGSPVRNFNHRKVVQYIYQSTTDKVDDGGFDDKSDGHGTHVSGTVAGLADRNYGDFSDYRGISAGARIAFMDIGKTGDPNLKLPSPLDTGMYEKFYNTGARVMTNSWGSEGELSYDSKCREVDLFMRRYPDAILFFSAGNTGASGPSTIGTPASAKNVATVGASLNDINSWKAYTVPSISSDHTQAAVGYFSSQGPTGLNFMKPDFLAPGYYITSAKGTYNSAKYHCDVHALVGTSMAAPTAAAFAVKVRQYYLKGFYPTGNQSEADSFIPSGALIKATLMHSGQRMTGIVQDNPASYAYTPIAASNYPSNVQGYGRIQMDKVLNFGVSTANPLTLFIVGGADPDGPHYSELTVTGETQTHTFVPSTTDPVRITMCYTDLPGDSFANSVMKNILTLSVRDGDGVTSHPYLVSGAIQGPCQMIDLTGTAVKSGQTYTVSIRADTLIVPGDLTLGTTQPYALVISQTKELTYLNLPREKAYKAPQHSATYINSGSIVFIVILSVFIALIGGLLYYFRRITKKSRSLLIDPGRGAWTGEGQAGAMGMVLRMRQRALEQKNTRASGRRNNDDYGEYDEY